MSEVIEPYGPDVGYAPPPSHQRILIMMAVLGVLGGIAGVIWSSPAFGLGMLIGTALALVNYYWLKNSLGRIFKAAETGERPRMLAGKYFLRYIILAGVVALIYATGPIPVVPVIVGLAAFGFAVVIEGLIRIFSGTGSEEPSDRA